MKLTRFTAQNAQFHEEGSFVLASDAEKEIERLTRERDELLQLSKHRFCIPNDPPKNKCAECGYKLGHIVHK